MIQNRTRFHPTCTTGPLHLGHLYNILVNQAEAHKTGGQFIIRFDDTQDYWLWAKGKEQGQAWEQQTIDDLAWLGISPDYYSWSSELLPQAIDLVENWFHSKMPSQKFTHEHIPQVIGSNINFCPYYRRFTVEHVVMDFIEGINLLIRGWDLMTEDCLYAYFCDEWGIACPTSIYIPRLQFEGDQVSKTNCNFRIEQFRQADWLPRDIISNLRKDCLKWDNSDWLLDQLNPNPILGEWAKEVGNVVSR